MNTRWNCALELTSDRREIGGSSAALAAAIARGADLRVYTEWRFEEHIAPFDNVPVDPLRAGLIEEVIDFRQTILLDKRHVAGVTTLRQPLLPTVGFNDGPPRMSFFLYNCDGWQACANLLLDNSASETAFGNVRLVEPPPPTRKMSTTEAFDAGTCAPCRNFIYDMETYRFFVRDDWQAVYAHGPAGEPVAGQWADLRAAIKSGCDIKLELIAIDTASSLPHSIFTMAGSCFIDTTMQTIECGTHPFVRVRPSIPLKYASGNWDVVWASVRTDGRAVLRCLNPQTRRFDDHPANIACRWFAR